MSSQITNFPVQAAPAHIARFAGSSAGSGRSREVWRQRGWQPPAVGGAELLLCAGGVRPHFRFYLPPRGLKFIRIKEKSSEEEEKSLCGISETVCALKLHNFYCFLSKYLKNNVDD